MSSFWKPPKPSFLLKALFAQKGEVQIDQDIPFGPHSERDRRGKTGASRYDRVALTSGERCRCCRAADQQGTFGEGVDWIAGNQLSLALQAHNRCAGGQNLEPQGQVVHLREAARDRERGSAQASGWLAPLPASLDSRKERV